MNDVRMEITSDTAENITTALLESIVYTCQGTLQDNTFFIVGKNNLKLGRYKIRKYVVIMEKCLNEWSSCLELFMTDNEKKFNQLMGKYQEVNVTQIMDEFYDKDVDFLDFDNYMTAHGYYSVWEDCRENPALATEIKKDGWMKYVPINDDMKEIKIEFKVTADNGEEESPDCFYMKVTDVYEV